MGKYIKYLNSRSYKGRMLDLKSNWGGGYFRRYLYKIEDNEFLIYNRINSRRIRREIKRGSHKGFMGINNPYRCYKSGRN